MIARGYRYWLSWLAEKGLCDPNLGPAARVTRERVENYVAELKPTRSPYTVLCRVQNLYDALRAMAPEADWSWLLEIYRTLSAGVRPVRDKLARLRSIDELVALGECLMVKAEETVGLSEVRRAVLFRDGLMIALLSYRPIRRKNFAGMRLSRHLRKVGANWHILLAADETKTRVSYQAIFPSTLTSKLERYLNVHRPVLLRGKRVRDHTNRTIFRERETPDRSRTRRSLDFGGGNPSHAKVAGVPDRQDILGRLSAKASPRTCFVTLPRPRSPSTARNTSGTLLWFSAMLITERPKSTTIMRGAWKPRVATRRLSRVYAKASRPTGIAKGDLHARGHLRPLFVRAAARGLDRRSDPALQGKNRTRGLRMLARVGQVTRHTRRGIMRADALRPRASAKKYNSYNTIDGRNR